MTDTPQVLLAHHLKTLKLPTFLREYDKIARQCAAEGVDHVRYLLRLAELELIDRERRMVERRIRQAKFPTPKSLDSFDFKAIASLNKMLVLELARCAYIERRENVIALGCVFRHRQESYRARSWPRSPARRGSRYGARVHNGRRPGSRTDGGQGRKTPAALPETAGEIPLADYRRAWIRAALQDWPVQNGAELLFEVFSQRYERGSIMGTSNLPFDEWTEVFGSERLTGALLDRLTHHVHILEMNGESYRLNLEMNGESRLNQSRSRQTAKTP